MGKWNGECAFGDQLPCKCLWDMIEGNTEQNSQAKEDYYTKRVPVTFIHRDRTKEQFFEFAGETGGTSLRTICRSKQQIKLVALGLIWLAVQFQVYSLEASFLLQITLKQLDQEDPAYPGASVSLSGDDPGYNHTNLYDVAFIVLPDWSYRPPWLKIGFVDVNVYVGQFMPWPMLLMAGRTSGFIRYVGTLGTINILKGLVQLLTVLPPARQGQECWLKNFEAEELEYIANHPMTEWLWRDFPTYFTMGAARGCNDMLWSGHTAQTILGWLYIVNVIWLVFGFGRVYKVATVLISLYLIAYVLAVLVCRMHYTIDVLCAALLAFFMYTHTKLGAFMWQWANRIVCNEDPKMSSDEDGLLLAQQSPRD